jgi:hypothetical protein
LYQPHVFDHSKGDQVTAVQALVKNQKNQSETKITGRGGPRGGGRPKGSVSEATKKRKALEATLKEMAAEHTADALGTLVDIMQDVGNPPAARVSAATQILDRGHGKPTQTIAGDPDNPLHVLISRIELVAPSA